MATREQLDHLRQRIRHTARLIYRDLGRDAGPAEQRSVRAMDDDGIHWTRPDGSEGRTAWPLPWECSIIGETLTFYVPGSDVASFSRTISVTSTVFWTTKATVPSSAKSGEWIAVQKRRSKPPPCSSGRGMS